MRITLARQAGRWGFFFWAAVGFLMSFGTLAILSSGIGATCLVIALIAAVDASRLPTVWATVGAVLVAIGTGPFWWLRCRGTGG